VTGRKGEEIGLKRALACLVSRESELVFLLRSLIKRSPPPPSPPPPRKLEVGGGDFESRGR